MSFLAVIDGDQVSDSAAALARMLEVVPSASIRTLSAGRHRLGVAESAKGKASLAQSDGLAVAFAGVLDNLSDLVRELPDLENGPELDPAAVVGRLFRRHGASTPGRLRGCFAAVISDGTRLWCFRDQLGFGTLFYRAGPQFVCAATEVKQVVAGAGLNREPDLQFIDHIFVGGSGEETRTAFQGVSRLPKRSLLSVDERGLRIDKYWQPERLLESGPSEAGEVRARFDVLMSQAVARTLTGNDVILLSGGLDSPTVAAFGAPLHLQVSGQPLTALSHVYPEYPTVDERPYIELVVKQLGLPFHTYVPETTDLSSLQEWVHDLDGPWQGWVPFGAEEQFRVARELGFSSILTGELAEFVIDRPKHLISHLLLNGRPAAALRHLSIQRRAGAALPVLARQVLRTFIPRPLMVAKKRIRPGITLPDWLDASLLARQQADRELPARERWNDQQTSFLQGAGLSMEAHSLLQIRAGVRMRSPWADVDLWEFFLSLPAQVKYPDHRRKALVRELMRGRLPDAIVDRADKTVFTDFVTADIDYPSLRRWLLSPDHRLKGVDYAGLANRLETEDLDPLGYIWAKDLAIIHAFLALW